MTRLTLNGHRVWRDYPTHRACRRRREGSRRSYFDRDVGKGGGSADVGDLGAGEDVNRSLRFAAGAPISCMDHHDAAHDISGELRFAVQLSTIIEYRNGGTIQDSASQSVVRMQHRALFCTRMLA